MDSSIITYCKKNKIVLFFLFLWLFRICFLTQGSRGSVAINKYVIIQILAIVALVLSVYGNHFSSFNLLKYKATFHFTILYLFGMLSVLWSIFPVMSIFLAFENLACLTAILYLSLKCTDIYQLERFFIYSIIFIIGMFFVKNMTIARMFHSVSYSSIAAMLTMYCLAEYTSRNRSNLNKNTLTIGLAFGIFTLIITTSGGAIFSTFITLFFFLILTPKKDLHTIFFIGCFIVCFLLLLGYHQEILGVLFPNKSSSSILTAHGRTVVWEMINEKTALRPLFGWGYAAVERILPIYCIDAHNAIIGVRGALGNIGCLYLLFSMCYILLYLFMKRNSFGYRGIFFGILCAFINSNTYNFLAGKAGPCSLTFQFLLAIGAAYNILGKKTAFPQPKADLNELVNENQ